MALNPNIILAGQAPDIMGALATSNQAAQQRLEFDNQNALREMMRQQGPQIMAGDQGALNMLAQFDPAAALGIQGQRMDMDVQRKRMEVLDVQTKREAEAYARSISAEQAAAEAAQMEAAVKQALAAPTPEAFDALMIQTGQPELVGQFENRDMLAAQFMSVAEILKRNEPATPQSSAGKLAADLAAGLITPAQYEAELRRTAPRNTSLSVDPASGAVTFNEGPATMGGSGVTTGDAIRTQITDAETMLGMIDRVANNPALPKVTGPLEGGGGNNVDDFSMARRGYYGGDGLGVIQEIAQLQGNAWLGARALLKGGGQITDYESKKAESAMARLSRAQGDAEFQAALKDLEDAIREGVRKLQGEGGAPAPATQAATAAPSSAPSGSPQPGMVEDGYRFKGGDPADPANWEPAQ